MISVNVKSDLKREARKLDRIQRKQIPFAASRAINDTAFDMMREQKRQMPRYMDRPTKWTINGVRVQKADKRNLTGGIYITQDRWKYLQFAIEGGIAKGLRNVPVNAPLNQYGAMRRNYLKRVLARPDYFSGVPKGHPGAPAGVWQRAGRRGGARRGSFKGRASIRLMAMYINGAAYKRIYPYQKIGEDVARKVFPSYFKKAIQHALKTAK